MHTFEAHSATMSNLFPEDDVFALGWGVQQATCTGYFKKENATFGFTKRWYKLQGHVLLYFENEHKSKAKGVIDVSEAAIAITPVRPGGAQAFGWRGFLLLCTRVPIARAPCKRPRRSSPPLVVRCGSQVDPSARRPKGCYGDMVLQIQTPARTYTLWPKYSDDLIPWQEAVTIPPPASPSAHSKSSQPTVRGPAPSDLSSMPGWPQACT